MSDRTVVVGRGHEVMSRYSALLLAVLCATAAPGVVSTASAQARRASDTGKWEVPRTPEGHPDLQGNWSNATLTPFEREEGKGPLFTWEEVEEIERPGDGCPANPGTVACGRPDNQGDGSLSNERRLSGAEYNEVYWDRGSRVATVDGEPRTSLITFPSNGRIPALTPEGQRRKQEYHEFRSRFGQYDHPELRPLAERCIVYYASSPTATLGPPMTPSGGYNNNIRVIQTADYVVIHGEMIHDTRIIRLGEPNRLPAHVRPWFGDSWGRWEGNTLVVETTNIHPDMGFNEQGDKILNSEDLKVIERFTRVVDDSILYEFEIHDPRTYTEVWGGQVPWVKFDQRIYEYACHEGNYALANVLSGARYEERMEAQGSSDSRRD